MRPMALLASCLGLCLGAFVAGCGDGGGGVVGTWVVDMERVMSEGMKAAEANMAKALEQAPPEQRALMKQMMPVGEALRERLKEQLGAMEATYEFRSDKSCTMDVTAGPAKGKGEGTWTQDGERVRVTVTKKNGQPVSGADATSAEMVFRDGVLGMPFGDGPDGTIIWLKRK